MSSFFDLVDRARSLLQAHRRVTLRGLRRELALDDETLDDLVEELIDGQQVAVRDGGALVLREPEPDEAGDETSGSDSFATAERRQLTVMFVDLVGSTELSHRIDPEELREVLRQYRSICADATKRFDGHIAQYLGDGVLVYFGYPRAHEDDAGRALRAGLEIQRVLGERPEASRISARIGIHTGRVVVDPSDGAHETLALGEPANLAAHIQRTARPGAVVVSDATLALCGGRFVSRALGETTLKGTDAPILLHEVERAAGVRTAIATNAESPMVGRDRELGLLLDRWEEAQDGRGQVVLVSGEPGIGKSRLVQALHEALGRSRHLWLDMQCSPFTAGSAFQPLVELMHTGLVTGAAQSPEEESALLVSGIESLPGVPADVVIPYLLPLLSLPPADAYPLPQTSAEEQRERTMAAMLRLNYALSEQQPIVLVAEDIHWADPSTLEYLTRQVAQAATTHVMLVLTFRPEFHPPWDQSHVADLKLARLSKRATREMISTAVGGRLPEPVLSELEARSDGVPLFIEELATGVRSSGVLTEQAGRFELRGNIRDLAIPATLQDSLMARLDRLSAAKRVAQQASTLGREFSYELIEAVTDLDAAALRNALRQLTAGEIVHQRGTPPDAVYTFKHTLLQDTAYESQLMSTRKALHGKVAAVLEERFPARVAAAPEVAARHCEAAGEHARAVDHYQRAAELALARLSNEEAVEHYDRALESLSALRKDDERVQREIALRIARGKSMMTLRGYESEEVRETVQRVEALCGSLGDGPQLLPALIGLVQFDVAQGTLHAYADRAEAILRIAEPLGIRELVVLGHGLCATALNTSTSHARAVVRATQALDIASEFDFPPPETPYDLDLIAMVLGTRAIGLVSCARPEQARESLRLTAERGDRIDHDLSRTYAAMCEAVIGFMLDDPAMARAGAQRGLDICTGRAFHSLELVVSVFRGWSRAAQGEIAEGLRDVEHGLELAAQSGSGAGLPLVHVAAAAVHRIAKDPDRALALLDRAAYLYRRSGEEVGYHFITTVARASLLLEHGSGDPVEAEHLLLDCWETDRDIGDLDRLLVATELARLATRTGRVAEAEARLAERYGRLTEGLETAPVLAAGAALDALRASG